jgi:hypothetical protein
MTPSTRSAAPESVTVINPRTSIGFRQHPQELAPGTHHHTTDRTQVGTTIGSREEHPCRMHPAPPAIDTPTEDDRSTTRESPHRQEGAATKGQVNDQPRARGAGNATKTLAR